MIDNSSEDELGQKIDEIIFKHNKYIDGIWRGTTINDKPPETARQIQQLINSETIKAQTDLLIKIARKLEPKEPKRSDSIGELNQTIGYNEAMMEVMDIVKELQSQLDKGGEDG